MKITKKLALRTLTALALLATSACDDAKKDAKVDAKQEAKAADGKAADVKADVKADDGKAADVKADDAKADAAKADAVAEPKAEGGEAAGEAAGEVTKIGVAECDDYIAGMTQCFAAGGVPSETRDQVKMGFDMSVTGWADAMKANPDTGTALAGPCKAALDMAKLSYPTCFSE